MSDSREILDELLQKFNLVQRVKPDVAEDTKKKDILQTDG